MPDERISPAAYRREVGLPPKPCDSPLARVMVHEAREGDKAARAARRISPTQRSLAECRKRGWTAQVVEKWQAVPNHPAGGVRIDLFGCIDVLALDGQPGSLGVQACSGGDAARRLTKARATQQLAAWLAAGNRFEVWAWRKVGLRGKRKLWDVRVVPVTAGELERLEAP